MKQRQLRLALGMRGGVSLAVWIGGVCAEIDALRRSDPTGDGFWDEQLRQSDYEQVVVDVLAGASAGGLNGVLFGSAIRHGFSMEDLLPIWTELANIDRLRRVASPWLSLLDGDTEFLDVLDRQLASLIAAAAGDIVGEQVIDLRLSATLVEPIDRAAPSPEDEKLRERRSAAAFHFRYEPGARDDFDGERGENDQVPAWVISRLALAGRATSSFPGAFEPAVVRSTRTGPTEDGSPGAGRLVDCREVFSDRRVSRPDEEGMAPDDFIVCDGGVVDNIPLGKALDAVLQAPADRPTKRALVYLHPTGPPAPPNDETPAGGGAQVDRRGLLPTLKGVVGAKLESESIAGDIDQIERHNRRVNLAVGIREQVWRTVAGRPHPLRAARRIALRGWPAYRTQRAGVDAAATARLLADPLGVLGSDPFPLPPEGTSDDVWRSPTAQWPRPAREELDARLTAEMYKRLDLSTVDTVVASGLGPLRRACLHTIEYCRRLEVMRQQDPASQEDAAVNPSDIKAQLYEALGRVTSAEREANINLVMVSRPEADRFSSVDPVAAPPKTEEPFAAWWRARSSTAEQAITASGVLEGPPSAETPVLSVVVDAIEQLRQVPQPDPTDLLILVFGGQDPNTGYYLPPEVALGVIEVLCFAEHLAGSAGSKVEFRRISAAAKTPLAEDFSALRAATLATNRDAGPDELLPNVKLAGNELASFSAFLEENWRRNDWLWGRLDAVPVLVDLLDRRPDDTPEVRWRRQRPLVMRRQQEILAAHLGDPDDLASELGKYRVGLETLTVPGHRNLVESVDGLVAVGSNVLSENLPGPVRGVAGPVGKLGRVAVRWLVRPRGWPRAETQAETTPANPAKRRSWSAAAKAIVLWIFLLLVGVAVAAVALGTATSKAGVLLGLIPGLFVGLLLSVGLIAALLWKPPAPPDKKQ